MLHVTCNKGLYHNPFVCVHYPEHFSPEFPMEWGNCQGCFLSPILCFLAIDPLAYPYPQNASFLNILNILFLTFLSTNAKKTQAFQTFSNYLREFKLIMCLYSQAKILVDLKAPYYPLYSILALAPSPSEACNVDSFFYQTPKIRNSIKYSRKVNLPTSTNASFAEEPSIHPDWNDPKCFLVDC